MTHKNDMLKLCIAAIHADGSVGEDERSLLFGLATRFDATPQDVMDAWDEYKSSGGVGKIQMPTDGTERQDLILALVKVILVDKHVSKGEDRFIRRVAKHIGMEMEIDQQQQLWGSEYWPDYKH